VSEEECYKLNQNGKKVRDELLLLLKIKPRTTGKLTGTFNVSKIKDEFLNTTLDRDKTLTPLLNQTDETRAVSLKIIQQFFLILLERVASDCRKKYDLKRTSISINLLEELKCNPIVSNNQLNEYMIRYIDVGAQAKDSWEFPVEDLLDEAITPVLNEKRLERQNKQKPLNVTRSGNDNKVKQENTLQKPVVSNVKTDRGIVDLFWNLDYKQERIFEDVLEKNTQCVSFSIAAPCETTQKWLLNRLMRQIPNINDASIFRPIDLSRHPMRNDFYLFWDDLSTALGTEPIQNNDDILRGQNDIIRELCDRETQYPTVLIIYNFQGAQDVQGKIVQDFWERVTKEIKSSNKRTESSRLILFFIDKCSPVHSSTQVIDLDPLENISQSDVSAWLHKPVVLKWWQSQFERSFASDLINECFDQDNNIRTPRSILDRICFKFGLKNGVVEMEQLWEWHYDRKTD
jgi:hypothetical protein